MDENLNLNDVVNRIIDYTNDGSHKKIVNETIKKYIEIDYSIKKENFLSEEVSQTLLWIAGLTKNSTSVTNAAKCFLLNDIIILPEKYKENVLFQVFTNVTATIIDTVKKDQDLKLVENYAKWVGNGWISKLLNFISDFPTNGNLKIQRDIFSLLSVEAIGLDKFNEFATRINGKKILLEKKVELLSVLKDVIYSEKEDYAENLIKQGIDYLRKTIRSDLNVRIPDNLYSLKCDIKFLKDLKSDPNIEFLFKKYLDYGNVRKWLFEDTTTKKVIDKLKSCGFDTNLYVAGGEIISQKRANGIFSENLIDIFRRIVIEMVGSKRNNILPKISVPYYSPGRIFKKIKNDYFLALSQDKEAMKRVVKILKELVIKAYEKRKVPKSVTQILDYMEGFEFVLNYGGTITYKGAKVIAKVWKRKIPEDLYDSEELWCCFLLPAGEKKEIPVFMMDPKTTLLQFYVQGLTNPVSIAFCYVGMVNNEPVLLVDTWEGGGLVYTALGQEKMKEFVLESMKKFAKKIGAKKLLIFANPNYTRAKEFVSYLRDKEFKPEKVYFEAIDAEDSVLKTYSQGNKHHHTDAFQFNSLKGKVEVFLFSL